MYVEDDPINIALSDTKFLNGVPVNVLPLGYAVGSMAPHFPSFGVTCWPKHEHFRLFTGGNKKPRGLNYGRLCFQQEIYIYHKELGHTIQETLDSLRVTIPGEAKDEIVLRCAYCKIEFHSFRRVKYCSDACRRKTVAWANVSRLSRAEAAEVRVVLAETKPKIGKEGKWWRIRGLSADGTYVEVGKKFKNFENAARFMSFVVSEK